MNLFFRLVSVFLRAIFSKKDDGLLDPISLNHHVWLTDQDMFAHLTNSRYLSFSDLGTINFMIRTRGWAALRKRNWFPVICGQSMTVTRMLKSPQKFTVTTQMVGWTDTYVCLRHTFKRGEKEHAEVKVIARFASRDKTKVKPQMMIEAVGESIESPQLEQGFLDIIDDLERKRTR